MMTDGQTPILATVTRSENPAKGRGKYCTRIRLICWNFFETEHLYCRVDTPPVGGGGVKDFGK